MHKLCPLCKQSIKEQRREMEVFARAETIHSNRYRHDFNSRPTNPSTGRNFVNIGTTPWARSSFTNRWYHPRRRILTPHVNPLVEQIEIFNDFTIVHNVNDDLPYIYVYPSWYDNCPCMKTIDREWHTLRFCCTDEERMGGKGQIRIKLADFFPPRSPLEN